MLGSELLGDDLLGSELLSAGDPAPAADMASAAEFSIEPFSLDDLLSQNNGSVI